MPSSSALSRMYTSSGHSITDSPDGVLRVTVYMDTAGAAPVRRKADVPALNAEAYATKAARRGDGRRGERASSTRSGQGAGE
jgi:hypothetical protein